MTKVMTCVSCPRGCTITVEYEGKEVFSVTGNVCKRGEEYARTEIVNPTRNIASSVKVNGGVHPVVPVKTSKPISKKAVEKAMEEIQQVLIDHPVTMGDVIIENIAESGVALVACKTVS